MSFQIEADAQVVRIILSGDLTEALIVELGRELAHVEGQSVIARHRLTDLTTAEGAGMPYNVLARFGSENRARVYANNIKSAIVATKPAHYGMVRAFQVLGENPQVDLRVFKTREEAEAWLAAKA